MIGGANEYEIMETRDKLIDALNAVKMGMKYVKKILLSNLY